MSQSSFPSDRDCLFSEVGGGGDGERMQATGEEVYE